MLKMMMTVDGSDFDGEEYDLFDCTLEHFEELMDKNAHKIMLRTLMMESSLWFPDGRVVEYTWDEGGKKINKRVGTWRLKDETD